MKILTVGSIALDSVKTPFGEVEEVLGGSASYFSLSASFFSSVGIVGVVGADFPEKYLNLLKERGVDTTGIKVVPGKTFRWKGYYDYNLNVAHSIDTQLNVFEDFEPEVPESMRRPEILFLANIHPALQLKVLKKVDYTSMVLCDTMDHWIRDERRILMEVIKKVNGVIINEGEARMIAEEYNVVKAARMILGMGPEFVVIKRGEYGAMFFNKETLFYVPAYPLEVVFDPTGAGDSFAGGVCGFLAHTGSRDIDTLKKAIVFGSAVASFTVERFSVERLVSISQEHILERARRFKELVEFEL